MSDFIYSNKVEKKGVLANLIKSIYSEDYPQVLEFQGVWGSIAISRNPYEGFQVYESTKHICAVIGGPVLFFRDNLFLHNGGQTEGSRAILERWQKGEICWHEDLSGPFVVLIIDKQSLEVFFITDLMSYVPVYMYQVEGSLMLATHLNVLAEASNQEADIDFVSKIDFILHGIVTFPYTVYRQLNQIPPSSVHSILWQSHTVLSEFYWVPIEKEICKPIDQVACDLRSELEEYVSRVIEGAPQVAQFISGGEDSRVISALLPKKLERHAFIFLDAMNREGVRAQKAAQIYGAEFNLFTRSPTHYLDILPAAADLIGDGAEYFHAHSLVLAKRAKLRDYPAVIGGFCSDSLLKAACIEQKVYTKKLPFLPQIKKDKSLRGDPVNSTIFKEELLDELKRRRHKRLESIKKYRSDSAEEWFELWPSSMNDASPNVHVNRRLFRSYEPFMANGVVKIVSEIPQKWKLNRRLFHKVAQVYLRDSKWLFHSDGRLPYFSWRINSFIQFVVWGYQQISKRIGLDKTHQGSWGEWEMLFKSGEFQKRVASYDEGKAMMAAVFKDENIAIYELFKSSELGLNQRINLLHTLYSNHKAMKKIEAEILLEQPFRVSQLSLSQSNMQMSPSQHSYSRVGKLQSEIERDLL